MHGRYLILSKGGPELLGIKGAVLELVERWSLSLSKGGGPLGET